MILTIEPDIEVPAIDSRGEPMGAGRSPGIHVSQAIKRLRKAWGMKVDGIEGEQPFLRMFFGFVLEKALEMAFKWFYQTVRPVMSGVEYSMDGVFLTPDGFNTDEQVVEEYKLTWTSMAQFEADPQNPNKSHPDWLVQIMSYCRVFGVTKARLVVAWLNGDYSWKVGRGAQVKAYVLTFTDEEIENAWKLVLKEVEDMKREGVA